MSHDRPAIRPRTSRLGRWAGTLCLIAGLLGPIGCGSLSGPGSSALAPLRSLPGGDKAKKESFRKSVEADPFPRAEKLGLGP